MFICTTCAPDVLTKDGLEWPVYSYGTCEICGKADSCHDINSGWDWAFQSSEKEKGKPNDDTQKDHPRPNQAA
jgi:hypothetical protein